jgi:hypothetical protein
VEQVFEDEFEERLDDEDGDDHSSDVIQPPEDG